MASIALSSRPTGTTPSFNKIAMPGLALVAQLFNGVLAQGYGRKGTHALMLALEKFSG